MDVAADDQLRGVAALIDERAEPLTSMLVEQFGARIPELPHDPALMALLQESAGSNLGALVELLSGRVPIETVRAPAGAVEYARRLAQLGTMPSALLRAYRLGQQLILRWAHEEIAARVTEPGLALATSQLLTDVSFSYIDAVSEDVMAEYEAERARWLAHRGAVQRETVEALLRGDRVDVGAVESALGYRLRQHHLGLVLWTSGDLVDVERVVSRIAATLDAAGKPLVVLRDRETAWAWIPLGARSEIDDSLVERTLVEVRAKRASKPHAEESLVEVRAKRASKPHAEVEGGLAPRWLRCEPTVGAPPACGGPRNHVTRTHPKRTTSTFPSAASNPAKPASASPTKGSWRPSRSRRLATTHRTLWSASATRPSEPPRCSPATSRAHAAWSPKPSAA